MAELTSGNQAVSYNYGTVVTPFASELQQWDAPIGQWRVKAKNWRVGTICFLICALFLAIILPFELIVPLHTVYAVEMLSNGYVLNVAPLVGAQDPPALHEKILNEISDEYGKSKTTS